jgi:tetratricopeptide (TPR) repeat protein
MKTLFSCFLTILTFLLSDLNAAAQQSEADRLRLHISKETCDTGRIKLLVQLGLNYAENDSLAIAYLREAYDLSLKNKYRYGLAFGKYYEVLELWQKGKYDEAISKCKECIETIDSLHLTVGVPLVNLRFLYNSAGKQKEKFRYYSEKAAYYKRNGLSENLTLCYHCIGGYYEYLGDYDKAIEYYMRARDNQGYSNPPAYVNETLIIGSLYLEWGNTDKAEEYLKAGLQAIAKFRIFEDNSFCRQKLGNLYQKRGEYRQALQYYREAGRYDSMPNSQAFNLVFSAKAYLLMGRSDSAKICLDKAERIRQKEDLRMLSGLGTLEIDYEFYEYYLETGNKKAAVGYLEAALKEAETYKYIPLKLKYTRELHAFLLKQGDSLRSLRYLLQYKTITDSASKMAAQARIASFEIEQQAQERDNEIKNLQIQKTTQRHYYLVAGLLLVVILFGLISMIRYKRKRDREQLVTEFKRQLAQAETTALRAQMNPHFIFNCLNSINSFVMDQKHEIASDYLIKFSKLIRLILDNSRSETISLEKELETLTLYVILENARFENKFHCDYTIAEDVNIHSVMIPPMLLQPFVENAIWHGLMQKESEGRIVVEIKKENDEFFKISITDDGIGRQKAAELKSKTATHKSHGLKVTSRRIEMMNKLNSTGARVDVIDLRDEKGEATGTKVELIIPF